MATLALRSTRPPAWTPMALRSRIDGVDAGTLRRWLADLPPAVGYQVVARPLRYRQAPHLAAATWYEDRLIELQLPEPFRVFTEKVYYPARRRPGRPLNFIWVSPSVRLCTRREGVRFLYLHRFYYWDP